MFTRSLRLLVFFVLFVSVLLFSLRRHNLLPAWIVAWIPGTITRSGQAKTFDELPDEIRKLLKGGQR